MSNRAVSLGIQVYRGIADNLLEVYLAVFVTKSGGKVGIVGLGADPRVPLSSAAMREVDLIGVCRIKDE